MKKRILSLLAALLMVMPIVLTSCGNREADFTETAVPIYTLYCITEPSTVPESINAVELALNRIFTVRYNVAVKLVYLTADKYYAHVEAKLAELEKYNADKKAKLITVSATNANNSLMTADKLINTLEEGKDIVLDYPRFDIFFIDSSEKYYDFIGRSLLQGIDDKLSSEAKLLKTKVFSTFFTAAKVNKKTYGVPVNKPIGEYEYIVFDSELLEKYKFDAGCMKTMADLDSYLELIKEKEPDVIPLLKASTSEAYDYMFEDGFAAYASPTDGGLYEILNSYNSAALINYYSAIAKYRTLGYLPAEETSTDGSRFAVTFVKGSSDTLAALEAKTGFKYKANVYRAPIATVENTLNSVYSLSKYCTANEITDAIRIVTMINTDAQVKNIIQFGIEGDNYILDDEQFLERLNDKYMMKNEYTGNTYLAYTIKGQNPNYVSESKAQNEACVNSPFLGFKYSPLVLSATQDAENTDFKVSEPNYVEIISSVTSKHFPDLLNGTSTMVDYDQFLIDAEGSLHESAMASVLQNYESALQLTIESELADKYADVNSPEYAAANEAAFSAFAILARAAIEEEKTAEFTADFVKQSEEGTPPTEAQLRAIFDEYCTETILRDKAIEMYINPDTGISTFEEKFAVELGKVIPRMIQGDIQAAIIEESYTSLVEAYVASDEYVQQVAIAETADKDIIYQSLFETKLTSNVKSVFTQILSEIDTAIEEAVNAFIDENAVLLGMISSEIEEKLLITNYDDVLTNRLQAQYYSIFGDPNATA